MQAHDELSFVVELFHQRELFFQIHGSGAAHRCARFGAKRQLTGHEAACIEDEVGLFQHLPSPYGDKVGVTGACAYNLDVSPAQGADIYSGGYRIVPAFAFRHYQLTVAGRQQRCRLAHAGRTHVLHHGFAGMRHVCRRQLFGRIETDVIFLLERLHHRLVTLGVNRSDGCDGLPGNAVFFQPVQNLFRHFLHRPGLAGKSDADVHHSRHIADRRRTLYVMHLRRDAQHQLEAGYLDVFQTIEHLYMRGKMRFQPVGTLVADFQQQRGGLSAYEEADRLVHARLHLLLASLGELRQPQGGSIHIEYREPAETPGQFVQRPQSGKVALGGYHGLGSQCAGYRCGQFVGSADMSGQDGDGVSARTVHADYGGVGVLVLHAGGDGAYADAHGSDEDKCVVTVEVLGSEAAGRFDVRTSVFMARGENLRFGKLLEQQPRRSQSRFRDEHDGRLHAGSVRFHNRYVCFHNGYILSYCFMKASLS